MDTGIIVIIIMSALNLLSNLLSPLIISFALLIKNISHSECCFGSRIDVRDHQDELDISYIKPLQLNQEQLSIALKRMSEQK